MKTFHRILSSAALLPSLALAVYAPIPEQEQGKALTYRLGAGVSHDSNIFGGATDELDSMVYNFTAAIAYNGSVTDQTFASASYELSNDHFADRPGKQNLTSHALTARVAHAFASDTNIDLNAGYNISKNPQSLLAGVPLNTDQSFKRGQFDGRYTTTLNAKTGLIAKYRFVDYSYDNATLATDLDRSEHLAGLEGSFQFLPETKLVGEYRYQSIAYDRAATLKDKTSHFLMAGFDHNAGKKLMVSGRFCLEDRDRESGSDTTAPYAEVSTRYTYTEESFLSAGYMHTLEEPSDVTRFTDTQVNRLFGNFQHQLSGAFVLSGSLTYESSELQGRGTQADIDEKVIRLGLGLSWRPNKNWTVSGTYDYDDVNSDDPNRGQNRNRLGVNARYTF
jgi:opacity protein-like surface antigen